MLDLRTAYLAPEPPGAIELRAFTHGLMPRTVPAMMQRFVADWQQRGVDAWNRVPNHWGPDPDAPVGWWTLPVYLGDHFIAPLLGAPPGTCVMQPNVHWTLQCLLSAPEPFAAGAEVVLTDDAFPSVRHSVQQWASLVGLRPRTVPAGEDGFVDRDAVLAAIGPGTALVVLSHVGFTTGELLPEAFLRAVADRVHRHGGLLVVDGYHATGSYPVRVDAIGADVYVGGLLKEASGSSGNAFVYLRPGLRLTPRLTGWFGEADPFAFAPTPRPHPDVRRRFLGGTTAVAPLYHAVEGVRVLLAAGLDAVRADSLAKTDRAIACLEAAGLRLRSPREAERRSAMIVLEVPAADRLCAVLKQQHIYTDSRQGRYLRMAPFVWNSPDEVERACRAISEAVATGRYLHLPADALPAPGPVT
ncbi:MAG: aminotransferase class V-fold PLP-dependent enzyme [Bacteroidetes bacterium]|nr:hypothetical protein AWN76_006260 [Rhodothermaceae bacterium RA]RMH62827.1 MAG: aminotransferase class V-fold PLP-dependent enzyme [Bacteroidota bacterium]